MQVMRRVATALTTATLAVLGIIYLPPVAVTAVLVALVALVQLEFYQMVSRKYEVLPVPGLIAGVLTTCLFWLPDYLRSRGVDPMVGSFSLDDVFGYGAVLSLASVWLIVLFGRFAAPLSAAAVTFLGYLYIPLLLTPLVLLNAPEGCACGCCECGLAPLTPPGWVRLLFVVAIVKFSDMGGFAIGKAFGRHKLCPSVSPNKTWEGLAGSLVGGAGLALGFMPLTGYSPLKSLALGLAGAAVGTLGDLVESRFKREVGVKDSATFMPAGLGGFLDMFDSLVFVPAALSPFL